ncbi:MAG: hypothetical protein ACLPXB_00370 [Thiobacillaceae bacterium]
MAKLDGVFMTGYALEAEEFHFRQKEVERPTRDWSQSLPGVGARTAAKLDTETLRENADGIEAPEVLAVRLKGFPDATAERALNWVQAQVDRYRST